MPRNIYSDSGSRESSSDEESVRFDSEDVNMYPGFEQRDSFRDLSEPTDEEFFKQKKVKRD